MFDKRLTYDTLCVFTIFATGVVFGFVVAAILIKAYYAIFA